MNIPAVLNRILMKLTTEPSENMSQERLEGIFFSIRKRVISAKTKKSRNYMAADSTAPHKSV
jgi:hypothetical protein